MRCLHPRKANFNDVLCESTSCQIIAFVNDKQGGKQIDYFDILKCSLILNIIIWI